MACSGAVHGDLVPGSDGVQQDDGEMNDDSGDEVPCNDGDHVGDDLDDQVHEVKNNVIAAKTVDMYWRGISRYLSWLYQNKRNVLSDAFLALVPTSNLQNDGNVVSLSSDSIYRIITGNPLLPPITYDLHRAEDFEQFLVSLRNQKGGKPGMSVYDSLRSSLFHLYRGYGRTMPEDFAADLTLFFKGLKRTVARRSHASGQKLTEGKEPLSFSVLRLLCLAMMKHHTDEYTFAHTFLLISWNLMCRAGSTVGIHAGHMRWDGDAIAIVFGHMKNDQEGTRPRDARHVYANPFMPEICPVLSLAVYAAVCGLSNSLLFPGQNQYNRFSKILKRIMVERDVKVLLESEGLRPDEIGTHSARKGSATYVSSCSNGGPSAAAICIRAGWTLPGVQNTYIRYEAAGDRIVGRYAAGLPFGQAGFASLPPFFEDCDDEIRRGIELCFPKMPSHLIPAGSFFLASLVYHHNFLTATLPGKHSLHQNALFGNTRLVNRLKARVKCRIATPTDRIRPTGVPPHVHLLVALQHQADQLEKLTLSVDALAPTVVALMQTELAAYHGSISPATLDASISRALRNTGITALIQHVQGVSLPQEHVNHQEQQQPDHSNDRQNADPNASLVTSLNLNNSRLTRVPADFEIPSMTLKCAWEHWCCGDPNQRFGPYRFLQWQDLSNSKKRKRLSHYRCMMMEIQCKIAKTSWIERPTITEARNMLMIALLQLPISTVTAKHRERRTSLLKWSTALQEIRRNRRQTSVSVGVASGMPRLQTVANH